MQPQKYHKIDNEKLISDLAKKLFPICRSITGPGIRKSLAILSNYLPLKIEAVRTGTKVFDWKIPPEWHIREAFLKAPDGRKIADFRISNLSVVNFSVPVRTELDLRDLKKYLYTLPHLPTAVPYVTSYYSTNWGFCLDYRTYSTLPKGRYKVVIDSEFRDGNLNWGECLLPGSSSKEILLSTYLCHPSMGNNELSGPLVMVLLYDRISRWPKRRFTYRFYVGPETIGSLTFLSKRGGHLKKSLESGLVLTCLGGPNQSLSYKKSRAGNALIDEVIGYLAEKGENFKIRNFTPTSGSDERQYCSPGFNLPVGQIARTVYGEYEGYHNSLDTLEFMDIKSIFKSAETIDAVLKLVEQSAFFYNQKPYGEIQLGRRGLYPNINSDQTRGKSSDTLGDGRKQLNAILNILNYSDGQHNMIDIARICRTSVERLAPIVDRLEQEGLLGLEEAER